MSLPVYRAACLRDVQKVSHHIGKAMLTAQAETR
jgi:hypothetical protein